MSNPLKPLSIGLGPRIEALEARAQSAIKLTDRVRAALPEAESKHVIAASYRDEDLIIVTDSAAWCTRIRYLEDELRAALKSAGEKEFARLKVRVGMGEQK